MVLANFMWSQCQLSNMTAEATECNALGKFYVHLNFEHQGNSDSFTIVGNGKNYGRFAYNQLPIELGPLTANCTTNYEFLARDVNHESCTTFINFGQKCCDNQCAIKFVEPKATACENGSFSVSFGLNHELAPTNGFDLFANGKFLNYYSYNDLPIKNLKIESNKSGEQNFIVACANDQPHCCDTLYFENDCYCHFNNIKYQIVECNEDSETFSIRFNFKYANVIDSFKVGGNGHNYGTFSYHDLPIKIDSLPFKSDGAYEFLFVDTHDPLCFGVVEVPHIDTCIYHCNISEIKAKPTDCNADNVFYVNLSFNSFNTGLKGFIVRGNGVIYDTLEYGLDQYKIGPLKGDCTTLYEFAVVDIENPDCRSVTHLPEPVCCKSCQLSELTLKESCENNLLDNVILQLNHAGTSANFNLFINGVLIGKYAYSQLPLIIPSTVFKQTRNSILVKDGEIDGCAIDKILEITCHLKECGFQPFDVITSDCVNDQYYIKIPIKNPGHGSKGFTVKLDGVLLGTYEYGKDYYPFGPFESNCDKVHNLVIRDVEFESCVIEAKYGPICCSECDIKNLAVTTTDCTEDGRFYALLKFTSTLKGVHPIVVKVNNNNFDTLYHNLDVYEIGPLESNCGEAHKFLIYDLNHPDCAEDIRLAEPKCCESCSISDPTISLGPCEDGHFTLTLNFEHLHNSNGFKVKTNDIVSSFLYTDLPVSITLKGNTPYNISIWDNEREDCFSKFTLPAVECTTSTNTWAPQDFVITDMPDYIIIDSPRKCEVSLMQLDGRLIQKLSNNGGRQEIEKGNLPTGVYILSVASQRAHLSKKVVVLH